MVGCEYWWAVSTGWWAVSTGWWAVSTGWWAVGTGWWAVSTPSEWKLFAPYTLPLNAVYVHLTFILMYC